MVVEDRNDIRNNESSGGPDDQERRQGAQSLLEPKHIRKFIALKL